MIFHCSIEIKKMKIKHLKEKELLKKTKLQRYQELIQEIKIKNRKIESMRKIVNSPDNAAMINEANTSDEPLFITIALSYNNWQLTNFRIELRFSFVQKFCELYLKLKLNNNNNNTWLKKNTWTDCYAKW